MADTATLAGDADMYEQTALVWPPMPSKIEEAGGSAAVAATTARKVERRARSFAAKFCADTVRLEPPEYIEPTDANLARVFANCVKPPPVELYDAIRAAFGVLTQDVTGRG